MSGVREFTINLSAEMQDGSYDCWKGTEESVEHLLTLIAKDDLQPLMDQLKTALARSSHDTIYTTASKILKAWDGK